ncbi:MAG: hypothetical protein ACQESK_09735 [Bacteroidota bacterium]
MERRRQWQYYGSPQQPIKQHPIMLTHKTIVSNLLILVLLTGVSGFVYAQTENDPNYTREWGTYFSPPVNISLDDNGNLWLAFQGLSENEGFII